MAKCYVCGSTYNIHLHHIFYGPNRRNSDRYKCCKIHLCQDHHEGPHGVHGKYGHELDQELKKKAQKEFEDEYGHEKFMEVFGRNYLEEE